ncbi:MAG: hypothetical protein EP297_14505 [Gammaproteobacteria bacterium]|nr:MAG: hypothetical protein EP297_14505 [Gammaproteobacteria bacterium]
MKEGARLVAEANKTTKHNQLDKGKKDHNDYWFSAPLKPSDALKSIDYKAYLEEPSQWLASHGSELDTLVSDNQVLLNRFEQVLGMKQYRHALKYDINMPLLTFGEILPVKKLTGIGIYSGYVQGDRAEAIEKLKRNIDFSRLMLGSSSMLLEKMVALELLRLDLDTYENMLREPDGDGDLLPELENFTVQERTLLQAYKGEFAYLSTSLRPENLYSAYSQTGEVGLMQRIGLLYVKPRKLENRAYREVWSKLVELEDEPLSVRQKTDFNPAEEISFWDGYTDPVGNILFSIAMPSYSPYMDKIDHQDARIILLRTARDIKADNIASDEVQSYINGISPNLNPGYAGAKVIWNASDKVISYSVPDYSGDDIPRFAL